MGKRNCLNALQEKIQNLGSEPQASESMASKKQRFSSDSPGSGPGTSDQVKQPQEHSEDIFPPPGIFLNQDHDVEMTAGFLESEALDDFSDQLMKTMVSWCSICK